ncbi:MAG: hypothetical protein QM756_03745 [Polyangiaceae bacterium]
MMTSLRVELSSLLLCLGLCGCASSWASSERQVLPSFATSQFANKRLFIAPYALKALDPERAVPLEEEQLKELGRAYKDDDPNRAALKAFYSTGAEGAKGTLSELGLPMTVVDLPNARWQDYFQDSEQFLNVTVDGKLRYQVPEQKLLRELGVDADFVVVLGSLAYSTTTTIRTSSAGRSRSDSADFEGHFLVWDYRASQVIAEGKVEAGVLYKREPTPDILLDLGRETLGEILAKRPFRG